MTNAIDMQLISSFGTTNLWPMIALSNIAQGSAVLAIVFYIEGMKRRTGFNSSNNLLLLGSDRTCNVWDQLKYCTRFCCISDCILHRGNEKKNRFQFQQQSLVTWE